MRAFLGLGSNLGDRWAHLRQAVASMPDVVAVSPVYETSPVGGPPGQGPYLNCVVELVPPRTLPRTSSGKLSRTKARNLYLSGEIQPYDIAA